MVGRRNLHLQNIFPAQRAFEALGAAKGQVGGTECGGEGWVVHGRHEGVQEIRF